jgi:hypothetical protein
MVGKKLKSHAVPENPAEFIPVFKSEDEEIHVLTPEEVQRLLAGNSRIQQRLSQLDAEMGYFSDKTGLRGG